MNVCKITRSLATLLLSYAQHRLARVSKCIVLLKWTITPVMSTLVNQTIKCAITRAGKCDFKV